jgi:hypothetical protein
MMNTEQWVSLASISLFVLLALTSLYYYLQLRSSVPVDVSLISSTKALNVVSKQQFARESKSFFFLVLCCSAVCDIPFYAGCLYREGPHQCV